MATIDPYLIDHAALRLDWTGETPPLAIINLDQAPLDPEPLRLPPFPIIGVGDPTHPIAGSLDAVVESPIPIARIIEQVTRHPRAAVAAMQLLRITEKAGLDDALTMESICFAMLQGSADHERWLDTQPAAEPMPAGQLALTRHGGTLRIVIDRPAALNAIDRHLRDALFEAFTMAALDCEIKRVELRSVGRAFSTGADLAEFGTTRDPASAHHIRSLTLPARPLMQCADRVDVHVQGACVGSALEMVAFARRITASPSAWFQLPELAMGVIPGAGGCVSIPRRIGRQRAALMILSGKRIDAETALRWGLIDTIMDKAPVDPRGTHAD